MDRSNAWHFPVLMVPTAVVGREVQGAERDRRARIRNERAEEDRMAARENVEMRRRAELEGTVGPSGQGVATITPDGSSSGGTALEGEEAHTIVDQNRPIGPDQPVVTPVAERDNIRQTMSAPLFERLLNQTTDVQAQLADRVRGIEELIMAMPTRADLMAQESRKAETRAEVERQGRRPAGTENIPRTERRNSPYGQEYLDTAGYGTSGRTTEEVNPHD